MFSSVWEQFERNKYDIRHTFFCYIKILLSEIKTNKSMAYNFKNLNISKISVIGAGQIGPDIALHFSKSLSPFGVSVIVVDISPQALEKAKEKAHKKIAKGVEAGAFKPEQAEKIKNALIFSADYEQVRNSQIVVEAATEDENIKDKIFCQVEMRTEDACISLSNSSHM